MQKLLSGEKIGHIYVSYVICVILSCWLSTDLQSTKKHSILLEMLLYVLIKGLCVCEQSGTLRLVLMVASAAFGGTLQYGYNLAIMNAPTTVSLGLCGLCPTSFMLWKEVIDLLPIVHEIHEKSEQPSWSLCISTGQRSGALKGIMMLQPPYFSFGTMFYCFFYTFLPGSRLSLL